MSNNIAGLPCPLVESFEGVSNKRKRKFCNLLSMITIGLSEMGGIVRLVNLIGWEVCSIYVGGEFWLKGCSDASQSVKVDPSEELVVLDLTCTSTTQSVFCVANKTIVQVSSRAQTSIARLLPSDQILSIRTKLDVFWEVQGLAPVYDLTVGVMGVFGTERWPANLTLEHDRTKTPPIAVGRVT